MAELIVYASWADVEEIRRFVNEDPEVAWIVKADQSGCNYKWRACLQVESIAGQDYAIWHMRSGPLNIPSGSPNKRDKVVTDPFRGWNQVLDGESHTAPWFGGNLPGPYSFRFRESGGEKAGALGRSGFNWLLDRYKSIGMPAHPEAKRWWQRLKRFLKQNATVTPWPNRSGRVTAYVFPDALKQVKSGRHRDVNP
jgi:hypothetical protein